MRGIILSFSGQDGIVSSGGTQYPFQLSQWKSDQPPAAGQSVEFTLDGTAIASVTRVDTAKVVEEKARIYLEHARQMSGKTYVSAGKSVAAGYAIFALMALFADTIRDIPITLPGLVNGFSWGALMDPSGLNGGFGFLIVLLAILSIAVPAFWQRPAASLAYTLPLIITFIGIYNLYAAVSSVTGMVGAFDRHAGSAIDGRVFEMITLWFWLMLFAAIYLAVVGVSRYRQQQRG